MRKILIAALLMTLVASCNKKPSEQKSDCLAMTIEEIQALIETVKAMPLEPVAENEVAELQTNFGTLVLEFFPEKAPQHTSAFKRLINAGYLECTTFHRLVPGFMIQGGDILTRDEDPQNDGKGPGPGYRLMAEFNDIPHDRGIVSMARTQDPNSAGSQFFICFSREKSRHLDGLYTVFARVIEGEDVLAKMEQIPTVDNPNYGSEKSKPTETIRIESAIMKMR
ncbi:MAG TPA: peptidylprolyl isomerase [bacterium]|jgi:peptidyl-prolyl cis-trans isomerase B (cyclophilin B)|nr:peptidylprolyl isomerase [bacterium]HNT65155.1 peptidylprolyl isomerase [bacterium]HOX86317.1 peptidylprolyl isomerase [bacterium]HPG45854.1 peptidylprolyl isomerase [bacterium]HPM97919.1 peptidylprolyl isomerase [bacterium]